MRRHAFSSRRIALEFGVVVLVVCVLGFTSGGDSSGSIAAALPPVVDRPSIGVRLADVAARDVDDPRAHLYITDHVNPGTVLHRRIEVSDRGAAARIAVYADAAAITRGSFVGEPGHTVNDLTTWTSVTPGSVDLPANRTADVLVTIAVPRDASTGEHYGVIWAETRSTAVAPTRGTVTQVSRVGVRIYLSVGPGGSPAPDFVIESLTAERLANGVPVVVAAVHNTGGRALDITGTVSLSRGPAGLSAGPFPATLGTTLAIGDTEPVRTPLDGRLLSGPWSAHITLHSGLVQRHADATISFPALGVAPAVPVVPPRHPWPYGQLVGGVLAIVVLALLYGRSRARRRSPTFAARRPSSALQRRFRRARDRRGRGGRGRTEASRSRCVGRSRLPRAARQR